MAGGDTDAARRSLSLLQDQGEPFDVGLVHAALGDEDAAFDAFREIDRWGDWPTLVVRHLFEETLRDLREDPRYPELLRRLDRSWGLDG